LADGVHICPGAHLAGEVQIGASSWIGIGSSVCQGIRIGSRVTVGAGAVVTEDVLDGVTVLGVPARPINKKKPD
jgi:acetyltransferase-like isoleucine patch superfamily enzyme